MKKEIQIVIYDITYINLKNIYALYKYAQLCTCIHVHTYMSICTHNICRYRYIYILGIVYLFSGKKDMERSKTTSPAISISLHLIGHKQVTWPPLVRKKTWKLNYSQVGCCHWLGLTMIHSCCKQNEHTEGTKGRFKQQMACGMWQLEKHNPEYTCIFSVFSDENTP